jgi:hypothetical protein
MSWFDTGFSKVKETQNKEIPQDGKMRRFFCTNNGSATIVFLDDFNGRFKHDGIEVPTVPFAFYEHCVYVDGNFKDPHYYTCLGRGCPLCQQKYTKKQVFALTILNLWKDKEGKEKASKQLLVMPRQTTLLIDAKLQKKGNLAGLKYAVSRSGDKSPRVGNDFEYEENIGSQLKVLYPETDLFPFGASGEEASAYYQEIFQPKGESEITAFLDTYACSDGYLFKGGNGGAPVKRSGGETSEDISY